MGTAVSHVAAPTLARASRSQILGSPPARGPGAPRRISMVSTYSCPCSWRRTCWAARSFSTAPFGSSFIVRGVARPM